MQFIINTRYVRQQTMDRDTFNNLLRLADNDDEDAMNRLHDIYYDYELVFETFNHDDVENYKCLGTKGRPYLLYHIFVLEFFFNDNPEDALGYLWASMQLMCSQAHYTMAIMINENVYSYDEDYDSLMLRAMKMGNSNAFVTCGIECEDKEVKIALLERAVALTNTHGMHELGKIYFSTKEYAIAIQFYEKAYNNGNVNALFDLAIVYINGSESDRDISVGKKLLKKSIKHGNVDAMVFIANMHYANGQYNKSKQYYKMAAEKNHPIACYRLGKIYMNQNKMRHANKFLITAGKLGNINAINVALKNSMLTYSEAGELVLFHREYAVI